MSSDHFSGQRQTGASHPTANPPVPSACRLIVRHQLRYPIRDLGNRAGWQPGPALLGHPIPYTSSVKVTVLCPNHFDTPRNVLQTNAVAPQ